MPVPYTWVPMTDPPVIRLARGPQELRLVDGLTLLKDTDRIEPYGTYSVEFEAVAGQELVVTVSSDQVIELWLAEGSGSGRGRIRAAHRVEPGNGPYSFDLTITQTGCHFIATKNSHAQWLSVHLLVHCPALLAMNEKKGPGSEGGSDISAAASTDRLGNCRPKNRNRDCQQPALIAHCDPTEQSCILVLDQQTDTEAKDGNPSGQNANGEIETPT